MAYAFYQGAFPLNCWLLFFGNIFWVLAYNTYINAFNANLVANETFLDSAVIRENVVSLARNIGYVPRSKTAARAIVSFDVQSANSAPRLYLKPGLVCVGEANDTTFRFSTLETYTSSLNNGVSSFTNIEVLQGTLLENQFQINNSQDQRYILSNSDIDASTIKVYVSGPSDTGIGREFKMIDNILNIDKNSEIFFIQEVQDEKYEILFGDGFFGKKLENGSVVTVRYIITDGEEGNGAGGRANTTGNFDFAGVFTNLDPTDTSVLTVIPDSGITITTVENASNGAEQEDLSSIKYFAPRLYSAQYRAVTGRDYEAIIQSIYPRTESVAVVGGEELDPPQFGKVQISIKPKNGTYVSDFDKQQIKNNLKSYAIAGINADIIDLKVLYVELDSTIYYNSAQVSSSNKLKSRITNALTDYSRNIDINKFGGRFKYSKALQLIDRVDSAITSNITKVKIRRDMKVLINQFAQYELCFGNKFHINPEGYNIKSTGFKVSGSDNVVFFTDVPNKNANGSLDGSNKGVLSAISRDNKNELRVIVKSVGMVDYAKGEILLNTINITETNADNDIIEIQAFPDSNDVIGLKDLYLSFDVSNTKINMVKDVIASGEDVSGVVFSRDYYTSSYSNGKLERE